VENVENGFGMDLKRNATNVFSFLTRHVIKV